MGDLFLTLYVGTYVHGTYIRTTLRNVDRNVVGFVPAN